MLKCIFDLIQPNNTFPYILAYERERESKSVQFD